MAKVYIGTSGFSYPHWQGVFYPEDLPQKDWFLYYLKHFDTVELNVSFYRLPKKKTFEGWRKKAGSDFVFAVKGNRFITHIKRLKDCQEAVERFLGNASGILGGSGKSGSVVLWQLPPNFKKNVGRLEEFLLHLRGVGWRQAFEFRHDSWLDEKVIRVIREIGEKRAAIVFQDNPGWPMTEEVMADFVYLRFHGQKKLYSSCYTEKELAERAKKIRGWRKKGLDVYAYFNNDALGYAIENARQLRRFLQ